VLNDAVDGRALIGRVARELCHTDVVLDPVVAVVLLVGSKRSPVSLPGKDDSFAFLRARSWRGQPTALFRTARGLWARYEEYVLEPTTSGFRATDLYEFENATLASEQIRSLLWPVLTCQAAKAAYAFPDGTKATRGDLKHLLNAIGHLQHEQWRGVLSELALLPANAQELLMVAVLRLDALRSLGEFEADVVARSLRTHGAEPAMQLAAARYFFAVKQFAQAAQAFEAADPMLGGDAYLEQGAAYAWIAASDLPAGVRNARKAVDKDPTLERAQYFLALDANERHDWTELALRLTASDFPARRVDTIPNLSEFRKTQAYRAWREDYPRRHPEAAPLAAEPTAVTAPLAE
jgi:hypothetical protein